MPGRNKVELFEEIRRAFEFEGKSVRKLAEVFGVHRRTVRQAINNKGDNDEDASPDTEQEESDEGGKSGFNFGGCDEIFDDGAEP